MSPWPGHLAIAASAGTGKTFQLAHRFIRLVMLGEPPERIIALTFSRKAAREIFDRVIQYLAEAAADPVKADACNRRIQAEGLDCADYRQALRNVLEALPRSRVGTIDSFTVGIVRAFPYELGIEPGFQMYDSDGIEARRLRGEALRRLFQGSSIRDAERAEIFEAFKHATFGHEEKSSRRILDELMVHYQRLYRLQPDGARWGLSPGTAGDCAGNRDAWREEVEAFRMMAQAQGWPDASLAFWNEFCDELAQWQPEREPGKRTSFMLEKLLPVFNLLGSEPVEIKVNRKPNTIDPATGEAVRRLLRFMGNETVSLLSIRTHGLFRLVERCEAVYDETIRRRGFLTFEDALFALYKHPPAMGSDEDPNRLVIDYRLDNRLDHWLLDEFQDTSTMQWAVMANLIDEVLQDPDQRRTFFYVGDVKQAIYGWRGGNAALFEQILDRYNRGAPPAIERTLSNTSFRSSQPVLDLVNRVFGHLSPRVDDDVRTRWASLWQEHQRAPQVKAEGYAAVIQLRKTAREEDINDARERLEEAARLVGEIDPVRRGLTLAILCRSGDRAVEMADVLRARLPDVPVALEGRSPLADNPSVGLLLAVLAAAEHPGDRFALRLLQMSPLRDHLAGLAGVRASVQSRGFHATLGAWAEKLQDAAGLSAYETMRVGELLDQAAQADRDAARDIDRFVGAMREVAVEDAASRNAVRIMTIHKAKGLDFDAVILPDLQGKGGSSSEPLVALEDDGLTPRWILQATRKTFVDLDPRMHDAVVAQHRAGAFEDICVLYVAMTRAKKALYVIVTEQGKKSTSVNHAALITDAVSEGAEETGFLFHEGDAGWFEAWSCRADMGADIAPETLALTIRLPAEDRAVPSETAEFERDAGRIFTAAMRERRDFGSAVHALFERMEWADGLEAACAAFRSPLADTVVPHVRDCLADTGVAALFTRPAESVRLWREQPFEVMLDGKWMSGVFDRVVIFEDGQGRPVRADIIDFKTNRIDSEERLAPTAAHYAGQLAAYRSALTLLTGLPASAIRALLVFTDAARVVEV